MANQTPRSGQTAGAFDIRVIIAALFAIYGLVLLVVGLAATSPEDVEKAAGININLWSGIGMLVFTAIFVLWARVRPIRVPDESAQQ
ncbi:hypothetical protein HUO13_31330 [Saccharopolyspora erythraea]|uniref:hypothetical protein n=1 Tax=Saccharopolyspora erythraea TaxID=1836 RepID=UPI001BABF455|nr:hypothetical protein [Saccharopolyspora erythraea]QUH04668.1 hypothetical protein HUO13_31330 [Saccharopolyspora erythraea]